MSPILVRPVREQLEHDRVIRLLQAKYKRKFDVAINPGNDQAAPVGGPPPWYPDLVLHTTDRGRKLAGVVEVETAESVNHLEAMSQWAAFARLKTPFHLYVPTAMVEVARRFCVEMQIPVTEIWAYQAIGDQIRFTAVQRSVTAAAEDRDVATPAPKEARRARPPAPATPPAKPARNRPVKAASKVASKSVPKPAPKAAAKPVRRPAAPPARKKVARGSKPVKPAPRAAARKTVARAAKRR